MNLLGFWFEMPRRWPGARLPTRLRRRVRDILLRSTEPRLQSDFREDLARRFVRGSGIEIGALHRPLRVPPSVHVRYVDYMSRDDLLKMYPGGVYGDPRLVIEPDFIDDCERLRSFTAAELDFVVANHVLEHTEDPILALKHLVRVLRPGGVLLLTLPHASYTFDAERRRTTVAHVLRDHAEGPEISRSEHHREWALIENRPGSEIDTRVAEFARDGIRNHFHVWELDTFLELLRAIDLPAQLELAQTQIDEFAVVLRRRAGPAFAQVSAGS